MKKSLILIQTILFFILSLSVALCETNLDCAANAGNDIELCVGDPINLQGFPPAGNETPSNINWTVLSSSTPGIYFSTPNELTTQVLGGPFNSGSYEFQLCYDCGSGTSCDEVTVFIGEISTPASILPHNTEFCGSTFILEGSQPDPGVSTTWITNPGNNIDSAPNPNNPNQQIFTVTQTGSSICEYEITYIQKIGSCISTATTKVSRTAEYNILNTWMIDPSSCPACTNEIRVGGTSPGCGGTPLWTQVAGPGAAIISTPNSSATNIMAPVSGNYCFQYSIENGDCTPAFDTLCCSLENGPGFDISGGSFLMCEEDWELETLSLAVESHPNVTYNWEIIDAPAGLNITLSNTNTNTTEVSFSPIPYTVPEGGISVRIQVTASMGACTETANFYIRANPSVSVTSKDVYLLCGGDQEFNLSNFISSSPVPRSLMYRVLETASPASLPLNTTGSINSNNLLDLTTSGIYIFEIEANSFGNNPITNLFVQCTDLDTISIFVEDLALPSAGADISSCLRLVQLNGSIPTRIDGSPTSFPIPVVWTQINPNYPAITYTPGNNTRNPFVGDLVVTTPGDPYVFEYSLPSVAGCELKDLMELTILDCPQCELDIEIKEECNNSCTSLMVSGADTYLWQPIEGINDPTSSTPVICNPTGIYTVIGYQDDQACGIEMIELDPCEDPIDCDGYYGTTGCGYCGCGNPRGVATIYDSNGNIVDPEETNITWFINGVQSDTEKNPLNIHYEGPFIATAVIEYTSSDGSIVCSTTVSVEVVCEGDCPTINFSTCDDPPTTNGSENICNEYNSLCSGTGDYVWVTDGAGNPLNYTYKVDWFNDQTLDDNPYFLTNLGDCEPIPVRVYQTEGCEEAFGYFEQNCCAINAPDVSCNEEGPLGINWPHECGTAYYELEIECIGGQYYYDLVTISEPSVSGNFTYLIPDEALNCQLLKIQVRAYCENSESFGEWSNCVFIDHHGCFVIDNQCDKIFGDKNLIIDQQKIEEQSSSKGMASSLANTFSLYPNPATTNYLKIKWANHENMEDEIRIKLTDSYGRTEINTKVNTSIHFSNLDISQIPNGVYIIGMYTMDENLIQAQKVIINH